MLYINCFINCYVNYYTNCYINCHTNCYTIHTTVILLYELLYKLLYLLPCKRLQDQQLNRIYRVNFLIRPSTSLKLLYLPGIRNSDSPQNKSVQFVRLVVKFFRSCCCASAAAMAAIHLVFTRRAAQDGSAVVAQS